MAQARAENGDVVPMYSSAVETAVADVFGQVTMFVSDSRKGEEKLISYFLLGVCDNLHFLDTLEALVGGGCTLLDHSLIWMVLRVVMQMAYAKKAAMMGSAGGCAEHSDQVEERKEAAAELEEYMR